MMKKLFAAALFAAASAPVAAHALTYVPDADRSQVTAHSWVLVGLKFSKSSNFGDITCTWELVAVDHKTRRFITIAREVNTGSVFTGRCQKPRLL